MLLFIKRLSLFNPIKFLVILYPKSLANLVVEMGTRHSHHILFADISHAPLVHSPIAKHAETVYQSSFMVSPRGDCSLVCSSMVHYAAIQGHQSIGKSYVDKLQ